MIKKGLKAFVIMLALISSTCKDNHPDLEDGIYAKFITNKGIMIAKLHYDKVPVTVANFVALAEGNHPLVEDKYKEKPFYDGTTFHRVIDNFMIQGGDPLGTGAGTPGYKFVADFSPELKHDKPGILSMANAGGINTNGSQFFITEAIYNRGDFYDANGNLKPCDQPGVSCHSVFGELVEGLDVQDSISNVKVVNPRARNHKPVEDVVLEKVNIIRKGKEARKFDAPKVFEENMPKVEANFKSIREDEKKKTEAKAKASKEEFIKVNETIKDKLIKSETGIELAYLKKGEGAKPTADQKVKIECAGHFEDGELFWTTWKDVAKKYGKYDPVQDQRGGYQAFTQPYNQTATLIAGFKEALLKMNIGDKVRVFIPYHLGYGENGSPPVIPGKTDLVFDIELKEIVQQTK